MDAPLVCIEGFRCVIINWSTLDLKTFLTHFLGRIKNILQQLQNTANEQAFTSKIKYLDGRQTGRVMHEEQQILTYVLSNVVLTKHLYGQNFNFHECGRYTH